MTTFNEGSQPPPEQNHTGNASHPQRSSQHQNRRTGRGHHHHDRQNHPHYNSKRPHASSPFTTTVNQWHHYEDDEVDDLAVAAQYAFAVPTPSLPMMTTTEHESIQNDMINNADENEIDVDDEIVISSDKPPDDSIMNLHGTEVTKTEMEVSGDGNTNQDVSSDGAILESVDCRKEREVDNDDDDDAESDVDLLEQLAHMVGEEDDEDDDADDDDDDDDNDDEDVGGKGSQNKSNHRMKIRNKLMTVNEIDAYQADLHQIHDLLQNNVAIAETKINVPSQSSSSSTTVPNANPTIVQKALRDYQIAGHIQHHMVDERTIVILSLSGGILLKEGTALIIRRKDFTTSVTTPDSGPNGGVDHDLGNTDIIDRSSSNEDDMIQLGIILEIFGPVSQPLYSVRLPLPSPPQQPNITVESNMNSAAAVDETKSLNLNEAAIETTNLGTSAKDLASASAIVEQGEATGKVDGVAKSQDSVDPWGRSGEYTRVIRSNSKLPVYYWNDPTSTNVLDTEAVIRNSGRGCDASNLFDEEITDVQDYSDDEQERVAKGSKNKKNHNAGSISTEVPRNSNIREQHRSTNQRNQVPRGYAQQPPPTGFYPNFPVTASAIQHAGGIGAPFYASYPTANMYVTQNPLGVPLNPLQFVPPPQGFYVPHPQFQQPWYYYNGAYQSVPPPPPPPPQPRPPFPAAQNPPASQGGPTETVYYDFS